MFQAEQIFKVFCESGYEPNMTQVHMTHLLVSALNNMHEHSTSLQRILYMYMGERVGNTELWKVIQKTYPDQIYLAASTIDLAKALGTKHTFRTIARSDDLENKVVIFDIGGALYAHGFITGVKAEDAKKLVERKKLHALLLS